VSALAARLALHHDGTDRYRSVEPAAGPHVFGGLLLAQALRAAAHTVDEEVTARALHASFLLAGRDGPVHHTVERTRDGTSFATRRVVVHQAHGTVLVLTADFHRDEDGVEYEPAPTAGVPRPADCPVGRYDNPLVACRDVPAGAVAGAPVHARHTWFRVIDPLDDDPALHQQALAYLSDFGMTRAAREPHVHLADDARRQSVTLDHSVWFHRPWRADGWILAEQTPVATGRGRGLALGSLTGDDGHLVATVAQAVLLRTRPG
jgi:acyl-CoA thioesterase-2